MKVHLMTIGVMLAAVFAAGGQENWTLDDCMLYAVEHNYEVKSSQLAYDDTRSDYRSAVASFFPTVGASLGADFSFGRSIDPETNTYNNLKTFNNGYSLSVSWNIFAGGQIVNQFRKAKAQKSQAQNAWQDSRDDIAIKVMDAYVNLQYYDRLCAIMEAKRDDSFATLEKTRKMKELGMNSAVELSQAQAQFAGDDYASVNAQGLRETALLTLKQTMNYPVADTLVLAEVCDGTSLAADSCTADEVFVFARHNNPKILQAAYERDMAVYDVRSARGAFVPSLRLSAGISNYYYRHFGSTNLPYSEQMDLNFGQYVGVTLSIPLFSGLSQITTLKKAKNRRLDTQLAYDDRLQELRISIEQAVIDCRNLSKEAVKMEEKAVSDSIAYTFAKRKYKEGLMSFLDMQQTANTWYESQAELLKTRLLLGVKRRLLDYYRTNTLIGK